MQHVFLRSCCRASVSHTVKSTSDVASRSPLDEGRSCRCRPFDAFVLFGTFPIFPGFCLPICPGIVRGFSRFVPFHLSRPQIALTRNSPERVRDTIPTFPEKFKKWKPPSLETPPVWKPPDLEAFSQKLPKNAELRNSFERVLEQVVGVPQEGHFWSKS